jgi:hypothetical protein
MMIRIMVIEPDRQQYYSDLIEIFALDFLERYTRTLKAEDKAKAIYFIAQDQYQKYLGGAFLLKRPIKRVNKAARKELSLLLNQPIINPIWICGGIYTRLNPKREEQYLRCINFYQELYQCLIDFGKKTKISSVLVRISPKERRLICQFGLWPIHGKVKDPSDLGLIYSYLPLSPQLWDKYHQRQDRMQKKRLVRRT